MSTSSSNGSSSSASRRRRLLLIGGALLLILAVAIGIGLYMDRWLSARVNWQNEMQTSVPYQKVYGAFLHDIDADQLDSAYDSTTDSFRRQTSRDGFKEAARRYRTFKQKPTVRGVEATARGPAGGDVGPTNEMVQTFTLEDDNGDRMTCSITIVQEKDSLLYRRPPSPRVDKLVVSDIAPKQPHKP